MRTHCSLRCLHPHIHRISLWYPTIQLTCKLYNPATKERIWKSINVTNFVTPPPGLDKRSSKADEFSITYKAAPGTDTPESYTITANFATDLQISLQVARPASIPGFKIGRGEDGGYSYFGADKKNADGYVIHRFWPSYTAKGHVISNGKADAFQATGMMVHAIQGMRPNLVASRWNFGYFQSDEHGGVSAISMEFTTLDTYGRRQTNPGGVVVNIGSVIVGGKLATVTAETIWPDEPLPQEGSVVSRTSHLNPVEDPDTGYLKPVDILFRWVAPSIVPQASGIVSAKLQGALGDIENPHGLIEKVDVLAEIPYVLKMALSYVAGTKPYVYQVSRSL